MAANRRRMVGPTTRKPRKPFAARGGVKAQSKQGAFGLTWLGRRWLQVFEPSAVDSRLAKGRSYARSGQVIDVRVRAGLVTASVQGSTLKPYEVAITVRPIGDGVWDQVVAALAERPAVAARLVAGDAPEALDEAFAAAGASLFPNRLRDIKNQCECTDWSNPCKHAAAVYYLLCEQMDADPFVLFALRGRSREAVVKELTLGSTAGAASSSSSSSSSSGRPPSPPLGNPLPADPDSFWAAPSVAGPSLGDVVPPPITASLPARLGPFPFWRGDRPLLRTLEPLYRAASIEGLDVFLAEAKEPERNGAAGGENGGATAAAAGAGAAAGPSAKKRRGRPVGSKNRTRRGRK